VSPEYRVVPLGPSHDRTAFHSGVPELDRYLHEQAGQDARRRVATPFVMADGAGSIVGYYTLSAYGVQLPQFPEAIVRKLPRYPILPATMLGRLAISQSHQGRNLGRFLLMDALYRSWRNTSAVASVAVVVDALDDNARAFYRHHEFASLRDYPNTLFRTMTDIEKAFRGR